MKIISWNVSGIRAMLKKEAFENFINDANSDYDIICFQETKAEEHQVKIQDHINKKFPYCYWNSSKGTTQRKGFSGVSIWCKQEPINNLGNPKFDEEGRILALELNKFILINIYVPNSQTFQCERYYFRENWNNKFCDYILELKKEFKNKEIIICGDFNVAHLDIDICNPMNKKNKVPGFFDNERVNFTYLLEKNNLLDVYRKLNPNKQVSTYWSNFLKQMRSKENGWRIDYFCITNNLFESNIKDCKILMNVKGSDHCPLLLELIV